MSEADYASTFWLMFKALLPVLILGLLVVILVVGTIIHLIAEEREYRRWQKSQAKRIDIRTLENEYELVGTSVVLARNNNVVLR